MRTRLNKHSSHICALGALLSVCALTAQADEHLWGFVRGAETLPAGRTELYQFTTLRTGKASGMYHAFDSETEIEHGFSDKWQGSFSVQQNYFNVRDVDELDNGSDYHFAGVDASAKYRFKSPFKDGYGLAIRPEIGFRRYDDVGGLLEHELLLGSSLQYQRNYLDDTLIFAANLGFDFTWGKQPAEAYDHELLIDAGTALSYRFAPNWFAGGEVTYHAEYPFFKFDTLEHLVIFVGPSLHYGTERWWATLTYVYQAYGQEVDSTVSHLAFAEQSRNQYRLKIGFNF